MSRARSYVTPGRVELVGKHVDYGGGQSLTCAVELAVRASAVALDKLEVEVRSLDSGETVRVPLAVTATARGPAWSTYVAAVARRVARDFPDVRQGVSLEFTSDLPVAAGLSSSTALTITVLRAVCDAAGLNADARFTEHAGAPTRFAEYAAGVETGAAYGPFPGDAGVGVRGGAQDHVAIMSAREGMVGHFAYMPARTLGWAPWPEDRALLLADSGVHASKTGNVRDDYNRASDALRWLVRHWNANTYRNDATLADALSSGPDAVGRLQRIARGATSAPVSPEMLERRLAQFAEESSVVVPGVAEALRAGDVARVGALVDRSQALAEHALGNQIGETVHLARSARALGADAASAFGAGFGGAVWAMVPRAGAEDFVARWRASYVAAFPARAAAARFQQTRPGPAASAA